jgi:hypothetical protein
MQAEGAGERLEQYWRGRLMQEGSIAPAELLHRLAR